MTAIAPSDPYDPERNSEESYDDRAGRVIEDALERGEFLIDEAYSSTIGFSDRDPAEEAI
jgi:hypothetical protein